MLANIRESVAFIRLLNKEHQCTEILVNTE